MPDPQENAAASVSSGWELGEEECASLLRLARKAVQAAVVHTVAPELTAEELTPALATPRACFVTLRKSRELRGCIGQLIAREPLWQAVVMNGERAATRDFRFDPVMREEVDLLAVEISVLSPTVPLRFRSPEDLLRQLRPGVDGVVLTIDRKVSTFLPQVWEEITGKEAFMAHLAKKGGNDAGAWRDAEAEVAIYQVHHFEDP